MALHPEVAAFAASLKRLEDCVREHGSAFWAGEIAICRSAVENSDAYGVLRFLSYLGGTGSLNDLVFSRDGDLMPAENDQFRALLEDASRRASALKPSAG